MKSAGAKFLALFLISTMVLSSIAYFTGGREDEGVEESLVTENQTIDFLDVGGRLVNEPFSSIHDALRMTPEGVEMVVYVDIEAVLQDPALGPFISSQLQMEGLGIDILDSLYGANTTHMYFATFEESNDSFLLMTTFEPKIVRFNFISRQYGNYKVLQRMDTGHSNVLGSPTIFGPQKNVLAALDLIEGVNTNTSYARYETVLLEAPRAEYQRVTDNIIFADQFYIGMTPGDNNTLVRTTIYLKPEPKVVEKIESLGANSTERGFDEYNITRTNDLMVVSIRSTPINVISETYQ
ncbi:MAG TPA: hypothetical protein ENL17_01655 [Candidatus Methanoperedenaceae archaeon]|nr:hypothetical protein [Candidatus Methanoperedenaceae archaeon]